MGDGATLFAQPPGPQGVYFANPNLLINDFRINQRGYASAAALAAGVYGHDRWKAGASGGDYSFTQLKSTTMVTIAPGKSLVEVVEDANVPPGGVFVLSWQGTAQCRVGVNSATPSGAYASSPILISGQTAGTTMSVEAGPGTFGFAKLEAGSVPTPFVMSDFGAELLRCLRYYCQMRLAAQGMGTSQLLGMFFFTVPMRATPTVTNIAAGTFSGATFVGTQASDNKGGYTQINSTGANASMIDRIDAFSAEL